MIEYIVSITCAFLLIALVLALIFSVKYRRDMLGHEGEAKVFGLITVKGVAIVLLSALFLGGMLFPLSSNPKCKSEIEKISTLVHVKYISEVRNAADEQNEEFLEELVANLQSAVEEAKECVGLGEKE